jgi:hypothetical protein
MTLSGIVILSGADGSRSETSAESKDPLHPESHGDFTRSSQASHSLVVTPQDDPGF